MFYPYYGYVLHREQGTWSQFEDITTELEEKTVAEHHQWPALVSHEFGGDFSPDGSFLTGLKVAGMGFIVEGWKKEVSQF